jgi:tyrosyl-tRNA synthetase
MSIFDPAHLPTDTIDEGEIIKELEQRGFHDLDSLSLQELELLAERKRKQLHGEALARKTHLESELTSIGQQIQELEAKKVGLESELRALSKSLGLASKGGEGATQRKPRKPRAPAGAEPTSTPAE